MNINPVSTLFPLLGMAALVLMVWLRLYVERVSELRTRKIHPQKIATALQSATVLQRTQSADNFRNLFEMPVLFYVLVLAAHVSISVPPGFTALAWVYVALRAAHSWIHCTYNRVMHRFIAYLLSALTLWVLWGWLAWTWIH